MMPEMQGKDDFEAMLDRTLRARSQATLRAGFHMRLAESLRQAERDRNTPRGWWGWLTASLSVGALAALVVVGFAVFSRHTQPNPSRSNASVEHRSEVPFETAVASIPATQTGAEGRPTRPRVERPSAAVLHTQSATAKAAILPKLDTFPSPAPESDRPFGSGDPVTRVSREAALALLGLQQQQAKPITLAAINVNRPLFGESQ